MKKCLNIVLFIVCTNAINAQTVIHTKDGRTINVPVKATEISRIEFTDDPVSTPVVTPPTTQVSNTFIGKWLRKEGSTIIEYMDIIQSAQQIDIHFRNLANGPVITRATGQLQNNEIKSKGANRNIQMKMKSKNEIEYTSADFDGKKPWSCTWIRIN